MKFLEKYLLLMLLLANMTSEYKLLIPVSNVLFYSVMALSVPLVVSKVIFSEKVLKEFPAVFGLMAIYFIAQFAFQTDLLTEENLLYTTSKIAVFGVMALSISTNFEFYYKKSLIVFPYLIFILILVGWFINRQDFSGMVTFGFLNRNVACTVATVAIAGFLFKNDKVSKIDAVCALFLFASILYGGSRNALAMCVLIIMVKFGLSFKIVLAGAFVTLVTLYVMPAIGIEITAFDRLMGTFDGSVSIDREEERDAAWQMIQARPWTGWGYHYANLSSIGLSMNAHNGYLSMIENLGWPCGLSVLSIIIIGSLKRLKLYFRNNPTINFHLAIIVSTLFAANQEDYLIGVNQFTTNVFFMSFAVLGAYIYNRKKLSKG